MMKQILSQRTKIIENNAGFSVPDSYFSKNSKHLALIHNIEMSEVTFESGFQVPSSYFSNNKKQLIDNVVKKNNGILFLKIIGISAIAAVFITILGINWGAIKTSSPVDLDYNQLTDAEIIEHLNEVELNENLICDAGWCQELKDLNKPNDIEVYLLESDQLDQLNESI